MSVDVEIGSGELKKYVSSSKSVSFTTSGCKMPKPGRVVFDLSKFIDAPCVRLHAKRISGNGKADVISGGTKDKITVTSKVAQAFDIENRNGQIEIFRPRNSTGEIHLLGFTFTADDISENQVSVNWKDLMSRCGKHSCLRLVRGENGEPPKLFASTGAFIEKGSVVKIIETNPANAVVRDGEKIRFNSSCEITNLVLTSGAPVAPRQTELFAHRDPPTPINVPQPRDSPNRGSFAGGPARPVQYQHQLPNFDDHILFDSNTIRNFKQFASGNNKLVKQIRSNNTTYLVLRQGAKTSGSMASLEPNTEYIFVFNGKKLSGNGRVLFGVSTDNNFKGHAVEAIFSSNFTNRYVSIKTGPNVPGKMLKLHIEMPDKICNGEILIKRIMVVDNLGLENARAGLEGKRYLPLDQVTRPKSPASSFSHGMDIRRRDDPVYVASKKYAFYPHINADKLDSRLSATVVTNSVSGIMWTTKVKSLIKTVRIGDMKSEFGNDALFIGYLDHLGSASKLWIEPFDLEKLSASDTKAIEPASKVMTPSLSNAQFLRSKFQDKKIEVVTRPLPWVAPKGDRVFQNKKFVLAFERDRESIELLLKSWSNELPKLVIVGARGRYPNYVMPVNEYYPYDKLLFLMQKAEFIVDLPSHRDYKSSFIDLAMRMGKTVVSTNWCVLDKPNGIFVVQKGEEKSPEIEALKDGIEQGMLSNSKLQDMSKHNKLFVKQLQALFSL